MRSLIFVGVMAVATTAVAPLRSQSLAGARVGLSALPPQPLGLRSAGSSGSSPLLSRDNGSSDKWAKGMVAGAAIGLIVGLFINIHQVQNGGTHSAILPAVGLGALLGLLIGSG